MDKAYVEAKTQLLQESYVTARQQLIHAFGPKKAEAMIKSLFPSTIIAANEKKTTIAKTAGGRR